MTEMALLSVLLMIRKVLNAGCYNINRMVGDQLCISPPGDAYEDPPTTTLAPTVAITPAPVPTDIANGTTQRCGKYYQVQPDEYCNLLVVRYSISLGDFLFLNPDLYENCTNLYAYESYCIQPVGDSMFIPPYRNRQRVRYHECSIHVSRPSNSSQYYYTNSSATNEPSDRHRLAR